MAAFFSRGKVQREGSKGQVIRLHGTAPYVFEGVEVPAGDWGALIGRDAGGVDVLNDMKEM